MNKTLGESEAYVRPLKEYLITHPSRLNIFVLPPFTVLREVSRLLEGVPVMVGAQNIHWEANGAFTGEISAPMIQECGAQLVELGHSERRSEFGETDVTVNKKVLTVLRQGLKPLVCVGEPPLEKEFGVTREYVARQVKIALRDVPPGKMEKVVIAYEPVWAIGENGIPAEPDYANEVQKMIRNVVEELYGERIAKRLPILYGGSVNHENAPRFMERSDIDGLFVGRVAWEVDSFIRLIEAVQNG